ncbi:DUF5709 domain-containing protein [Actinotalea sp.]|uniref:DUF5709 domain-containing protein n=1 Tax=Actinotalea sp. TaxID=1872145 RepID=UPI003567D80E
MSQTPGTTPDPETGAEGDTDQLDPADTLIDGGPDDPLDQGWSPRERPGRHRLETEREQYAGDSIDDRVDQEEPEVWDTEQVGAGGREPDRAGRLSAGVTDPTGRGAASVYATDEGISGGGASAEEAAVHVIEED